ncbi:MAG: hypothetical protein M1819_002555 [Sarea resinae]|nr:MAG: hypothetical protein M1819_002555 [Sarea resinae]
MRETEGTISAYEHLKGKPREAEALKTLRKVASIVKPIMRQRGWRVGVLTEFYPREKNLLGINWNKGEKICLRLRYPYDERQFLPLEEVVDTMMHELCHIVHGPHHAAFHALWNQLRDEHEQLLRKGYTGEGFLCDGKRLGGKRIPLSEARRQARAAAEKRRDLTAGSGRKLGGAPVLRGTDMRQVIADAATRRATVTQGCASGIKESQEIMEQASRNGFRTQAEEDDANERAIMQAYIELLQEDEKEKWGDSYVPPSAENPAGNAGEGDASTSRQGYPTAAPPVLLHSHPAAIRHSSPAPATLKNSASPSNDNLIDLTDSPPASRSPSPPPSSYNLQPWACPICTLENAPSYLCCDACGSERPAASLSPPPSSSSAAANPAAASTKPGPRNRPRNPNTPARPSHTSSSSKHLRFPSSASSSVSSVDHKDKPLGWLCPRCATFMETQWWTCSTCGGMKMSS